MGFFYLFRLRQAARPLLTEENIQHGCRETEFDDCTLTNLASICFHKSTDAKFYSFTEGDKEFLGKIREDVVGGPSIVFTRKAAVDETSIRKSTIICNSNVGIDTSQL